jgi:DNA helicase II / ATP-dependent DNA helicase PcrA
MSENLEQEKAINKTKGPCIILAGAGTGKTYTIRQKIKYIVDNKIYKPEEILCLTFSNEATNNLKKKIFEDISNKANFLTIKTFHSFCSEIIKENSSFFKINSDFKIIQPDDSKIIISKYFDVMPYYANRYINTIQNCKDFGITIENIKEYIKNKLLSKLLEYTTIENIDNFYLEKQKEIRTIFKETKHGDKDIRRTSKEYKKEIKAFIETYDDYKKFNLFIETWEKYESLKSEKNYLDYGDLNKLVLEYFTINGSSKYTEQYKYVFVDEFQDTNKLQFDLIKYIAEHRNITVVGDLNQSIYGFRGAYKDSFKNFEEVFKVDPETDVFNLTMSYRSPNTVLNIAYDLIKNNFEKDSEECQKIQNAHNREGEKVKMFSFNDQYEEARFISDEVEKEIENDIPLNQIAILIRTHKQAEVIKKALELKKIPYTYAGKANLLEYAEIKTVVSYLSILNNLINRTATGEQAWWYLFHYENTLQPEDSIKIGRYLKSKRSQNISIDQALLESSVLLSESAQKIVTRVVEKLRSLTKISNKPLPSLVLDVFEITGLNRKYTYKRTIENTEHLLNLKNFYEIAKNYYEFHDKDLFSFIQYLEILDKLEVNIDASKLSNLNAVRLMTIHACKGLQFKKVILSNLAEKRFPIDRTHNEPLIPKELIEDRKIEIDRVKEKNKELSPERLEKAIAEALKNYEKEILLYDERRLCYVGLTRAEENLTLTFAKSYNSESNSSKNSVFLDEINYLNYENTTYTEDTETLSTIMAPNSKSEKYKSLLKEQLIGSLDSDDLNSLVLRLSKYFAVRSNNPDVQETINKVVIDKEELTKDIIKYQDNKNSIKFNKDEFTFSPSSIMDYQHCPKLFEIKNIYRMPPIGEFDEVEEEGSGSALSKGSYLHRLLELFIINKLSSFEEIETLSKEVLEKEFSGKISQKDHKETLELCKVFLERNKEKLSSLLKIDTEIDINLSLEGYKIYGKVDRVDHLPSPLQGFVDIVDYKTNKNPIPLEKRKMQLGIYALGLISQGYKVNRLVLDLLKLESPVEMIVDNSDQNNVTAFLGCDKRSNFSLSELRREILDVCESIERDYESEFEVVENKDKCKFCGYKFYCPKWKE